LFSNVYIEITNICNLGCSFCHGTKRKPYTMTPDEFYTALERVSPYAKSVFFHLMGEPTLHPHLPSFISRVREMGAKPILTTNGTLLSRVGDEIVRAQPYRVNISLHSFEANCKGDFRNYIESCFEFAEKGAKNGIFCIFRLWNEGGLDSRNKEILELCRAHFNGDWLETKKGYRIADRIFLEWDRKFDWPDLEAPCYEGESFCLGVREQIGILCDGTVVPCCLDSDGVISLGNIFTSSIEDILKDKKAMDILHGFNQHIAVEELCKKCSYRTRFNR